MFASSYAFLRKPLEAVLPLWPSVRRELRHARNLIPLACLDLTWRAHPVVWAQDAQGATEEDNGGLGFAPAHGGLGGHPLQAARQRRARGS